ncbi:MAG: D-amino-acid transaminase [Spirochaetales bacterium]
MSRIVYVNGTFLPEDNAMVSVFDRGFLFSDAVYEVVAVVRGKLLDFEGHLKRLRRSLSEIDMENPFASEGELLSVFREIVDRNQLGEGAVYLQITRGVADRSFLFPEAAKPTVVVFTQEMNLVNNPAAERGLKVVCVDDKRWGRRDIKTVQLLYQSMVKTQAQRRGVDDAWLVENGFVTEATSSNAGIVKDHTIITRQLGEEILPGVTRAAVLKYAREKGLSVEERPFGVSEAKAADEAFVTSSGSFVLPVVRIDDHPVADGIPGPVSRDLRSIYLNESLQNLAW